MTIPPKDSLPAQLSNAPGTRRELFAIPAAEEASVPSGQGETSSAKGSAAPSVLGLGQWSGGGKKFDGGKAPVAQGCLAYFPRALEAVAEVSKYGAEKYKVAYADQNWRRVDNADERYEDALARHSLKHLSGEDAYDPESHLLHIAHRAWNALATLELLLTLGEVCVREPK